jgi:hypothetical protein
MPVSLPGAWPPLPPRASLCHPSCLPLCHPSCLPLCHPSCLPLPPTTVSPCPPLLSPPAPHYCLPLPPTTPYDKVRTIPLGCATAASHSTVPFPVAAYLERIQRMAEELAAARLPQVAQQAAGLPQAQAQQALLQAVEAYLYEERGFAVPACGRSNLPRRWEAA